MDLEKFKEAQRLQSVISTLERAISDIKTRYDQLSAYKPLSSYSLVWLDSSSALGHTTELSTGSRETDILVMKGILSSLEQQLEVETQKFNSL